MDLERKMKSYYWLSVPIFALGGVVLSLLLIFSGFLPAETPFWLNPGIMGNVIGSFILGYLAFRKKTKDIVSLFVPVYAVLILLLDSETGGMLILQILYAVSLLILAVRLEKRFT
ncbi:MAG: hypothetical protein LUQ13_03765 [Methanomicrobiales archaeon]|nr:hypothetical protein [Methanomicrobiales archaeon]